MTQPEPSISDIMLDIKVLSNEILSHGSPADRGAADAYYQRAFEPHREDGGRRIEITDRNSPEWKAYSDAYYGHDPMDVKDWGITDMPEYYDDEDYQ